MEDNIPVPDIDKIQEELSSLRFVTDQAKFNATMYQGLKIILDKLIKLEETIDNLPHGNNG